MKTMLTLALISVLAGFTWAELCRHGEENPAGYDVEKYDYPDSSELKDIWMEEVVKWEGFKQD